jgi:hypothetical protein
MSRDDIVAIVAALSDLTQVVRDAPYYRRLDRHDAGRIVRRVAALQGYLAHAETTSR